VATPTRQALQAVRRATLDAPALLSRCDGDGPLASADGEPPGRKTVLPPAPEAVRAVVVGYGPVGRTLCKILIRFGVQTCVIDLDLKTVQRLSAMGRESVFGDATRREVLEAAGIREARYLITTVPDFATRARVIASAHAANPAVSVISRARYLEEREDLEKAGATHTAYEEAEVAAELARLLLDEMHVRQELLASEVGRLREEIAIRTGFTQIARRPSDAPAGMTEVWTREQVDRALREGPGRPEA
jgi:voltage-gated potassium channel Kch